MPRTSEAPAHQQGARGDAPYPTRSAPPQRPSRSVSLCSFRESSTCSGACVYVSASAHIWLWRRRCCTGVLIPVSQRPVRIFLRQLASLEIAQHARRSVLVGDSDALRLPCQARGPALVRPVLPRGTNVAPHSRDNFAVFVQTVPVSDLCPHLFTTCAVQPQTGRAGTKAGTRARDGCSSDQLSHSSAWPGDFSANKPTWVPTCVRSGWGVPRDTFRQPESEVVRRSQRTPQ